MKKISAVLFVSLVFLVGCSMKEAKETEEVQVTVAKSTEHKQEFIIMDSVDEPLPPEAKHIDHMPQKKEAQQIPNAKLSDPIVITKMPIPDKE